jgi:hypothetical protein
VLPPGVSCYCYGPAGRTPGRLIDQTGLHSVRLFSILQTALLYTIFGKHHRSHSGVADQTMGRFSRGSAPKRSTPIRILDFHFVRPRVVDGCG